MMKTDLIFELVERLASRLPDHLSGLGGNKTYETVSYSGFNGGQPTSGTFVEVSEGTWVENGLFTFNEVLETRNRILLHDPSRDVVVDIDLRERELAVLFDETRLEWEVTGVTHSDTAPTGWLV